MDICWAKLAFVGCVSVDCVQNLLLCLGYSVAGEHTHRHICGAERTKQTLWIHNQKHLKNSPSPFQPFQYLSIFHYSLPTERAWLIKAAKLSTDYTK